MDIEGGGLRAFRSGTMSGRGPYWCASEVEEAFIILCEEAQENNY